MARFSTGTFIRWRLVPAGPDESCRWESVDRRWVTLVLGKGAEVGKIVVADSTGRREVVDSYQAALELAKTFRT